MTTTHETRMHVPAVSFGERIKLLRGDRTQSEIARAVGVSREAISQWESGGIKDLKPDNLLAAADYFGVSIRWLVTGRGPPLPEADVDPKPSHAIDPDKVVTLDIRCAACGAHAPVTVTIQ